MNGWIRDARILQDCVGKLPGPRDLKIIDFLDDHAQRWIAASPLVFVAFDTAHGPQPTIAGGPPGFVQVSNQRQLSFSTALIDSPLHAQKARGFGALLLVPGMGETLRVNGTVIQVADGEASLAVDECYLHCAKALIRSGFWGKSALADTDRKEADDPVAWLARCKFMALATSDGNGHLDVSPKGDPAGSLLQYRDDALWYPDRPGNRIVDSFRNILMQPRIAALALVPGSNWCMHVSGVAGISTDAPMREVFAVDGKLPKLVTRVSDLQLELRRSQALARVVPWQAAAVPPAGLDAAAIFRDHVKQSRTRGMQATIARTAVSVPGLMRKGLDDDYKKNLY